MADETDFFTPPAGDDSDAFYAVPHPGDDSQMIGDVYYGTMPDSSQNDGGDFFNPPPPEGGGGDDDGDAMGFAVSQYDAPPPPAGDMVEDVDDDDDDDDDAAAEVVVGGMGNNMQLVPAGPTPMSKWNDEWQATLLSRKDEENSIRAAYVDKAAEDVKNFLAERERRRETRMAKNRRDEQDKLEAIEADLENDNSWQKVVKMIDLTQDSSEGAVDTSRMKDILVLMKNDTARAAAMS
ncbi:hypothetical protein ACHAW5_002003 [Stephanodiscus triporus]|uniref:Clathrin light chain n=1 Tax=Stephanodiscus triporus TaxID=2934178 RepID=A0ABD3Q7G7_9STRA